MAEGLSPADATMATAALAAILDGLYLDDHSHGATPRHDILLWALDRFLSPTRQVNDSAP